MKASSLFVLLAAACFGIAAAFGSREAGLGVTPHALVWAYFFLALANGFFSTL